MDVTFYTFSKKIRSLKIPDISGTTVTCKLKDPCSILNPELELVISNPSALNYAFIPTFNRYYHVTDWTSDHGMWIASLKVDHLASWRSDILNTYQYVLRSASMRDTFIANTKYITTMDIDTEVTNLGGFPPDNPFSGDATYVLEISNNSTQGKVNGLQYLFLDSDQIKAIMYRILDPTNTFGWGTDEADYGLTGAVSRAIVDPLQYIGSTYMLPFKLSSSDSRLKDVSDLKVGFWTLTHPGGTLKAFVPNFPGNTAYKWESTLKLKPHPQNHTHGQWLNAYPWSEYTLYAGPFGSIKLNTNSIIKNLDVSGEDPAYTVNVEVCVDMFGKARLEVYDGTTDNRIILAKAYADVAVPFSLTQSKNNILSWGANLLGTSMSIFSGQYGQAVQGTTGLINGIDNAFPKPEVKGQNGSALCDVETWFLNTEHKKVSCEDQINTNYEGDPLCQVVQLSSLSGFCMVSNPWLPIACTDTEHEMIAADMTTGVYLE